jgi:hypothetical protein
LIANPVGLIDLKNEEDDSSFFIKNAIQHYLFRQSLEISAILKWQIFFRYAVDIFKRPASGAAKQLMTVLYAVTHRKSPGNRVRAVLAVLLQAMVSQFFMLQSLHLVLWDSCL